MFGDEEVGSDTSDGARDSDWSEFLWVVCVFVEGDEVNCVEVLLFSWPYLGISNV